MKRSRLIWLLILGLFVSLAFTGCQAQRKPAPGAPGTGTAPAPTANNPTALPTNPNEMAKLSDSLAKEAAKVKGVNKATVVLTFNTALVGLDLKSGADANTVKSEVGSVIKKSNNLIKNVLVSTDPELNSRLVRISRGIAQGKPVDTFTKEIDEIRSRLSPTAK
ncbi:MAG: YhcN/YlaJ family sporulation lipoprotein [Actinobacteria bacterium]|nr:YhcN/YlaJ family sporulation lipoprotein [Actinomycetota bacterium]